MTEQIIGSAECQECPLMELCLTEISKHETRQQQFEKAARLYSGNDIASFDRAFVKLMVAEDLALAEEKISKEINIAQDRLLRLSLAAHELAELSTLYCDGTEVGP